MKSTDITYVFGAGASCQAMPLVSNFSTRFDSFRNFINTGGFNNASDLVGAANEFADQIKSHLSFDTFFKKLFHQKQERNITRYKCVLLVFFLYEHLLMPESEQDSIILEKKYNIDPRYDALIAGLLKPVMGRTEFYTNINFITWNYDVNLEFALHNFLDHNQSFYEFLERHRNEQVFKIDDQIKVIHLNGFIYHKTLEYVFQQTQFVDSIQNIITDFSEQKLSQWARFIKFAWEGEPSVNEVCDWISDSSTIILIGYSLPLYNRMVDSKFLNKNIIKDKLLIIQDLKANEIKKIIKSDFGIVDMFGNSRVAGLPTINLIENCNSFFVPNSIFPV
ncbi:MAG TPA: hypothetical protein VHD35_15140 [Chitinophagaceae bacterium]|jgi:hypothetical protein|nr:hypothetical protein [Chitinophagaceae bacterium]